MKSPWDTPDTVPARTWRSVVAVMIIAGLVAAAGAIGVTALLVNIFQRQQEAKNPFMRVVEVTDDTVDPAVWGMNFPMQYDQYIRTVDMERTRFGGSEAIPHTPDSSDPRAMTTRSKIEMNPRLKRMWAGYAFAIDYREKRGHAFMLEDQTFTQRHKKQQYGNCMNCHASMYTTYKKLGEGDIQAGFEKVNVMKYQDARTLVEHPVACIDCHDPETMQLRITRPAFKTGIRAAKAAEGVVDFDVDTMATRQEMRTFVCAQCHVEYYFAPDESRRLTFPWHKGRRADDIMAYYDEINFNDWQQADTGAPMLKAQHPEFETWSQGTHAAAGVACADCHMPYMRKGALKISDHHVRSPLLNINNACQTCHRAPEEELRARVERIQERSEEMLDIALDGLMDFIDAILEARATGMEDDRLNEALNCQRAATFLIDFVEAENSQGFHAPQESARIFFKAMDYLRKGNIALGKPAAVATVSETAPESMSTSPVEAPSTPPIESGPPPLDPAAAPAAGV
ncbi:MAG: Cytochrome c-552 precursor [Candidatus Hydrogenedentes bacterium ADurb.Bin101]|nr:MAG: Cytochrome c-552 precursor [Candidatus Hydrogenedentes bacterium ADurb.Bin101]